MPSTPSRSPKSKNNRLTATRSAGFAFFRRAERRMWPWRMSGLVPSDHKNTLSKPCSTALRQIVTFREQEFLLRICARQKQSPCCRNARCLMRTALAKCVSAGDFAEQQGSVAPARNTIFSSNAASKTVSLKAIQTALRHIRLAWDRRGAACGQREFQTDAVIYLLGANFGAPCAGSAALSGRRPCSRKRQVHASLPPSRRQPVAS